MRSTLQYKLPVLVVFFVPSFSAVRRACSRVLFFPFLRNTLQWGTVVGTYLTKPGTPLGTPERVNVMRPLTTTIAIGCSNLTAVGTVSISEVCTYVCEETTTDYSTGPPAHKKRTFQKK